MRRLANRSRAAAFLCYHAISEDGPPFLSVPPRVFERQLWVLRRKGYVSGTLEDLTERRAGNGTRQVFITFDDGFRDNFTDAFPLLRANGFKAQVFVLPPLLDRGARFRWPEVRERADRFPDVMRSMTWAMAEEMAAAGIEFGSHGLAHRHLRDLGDEELRQELLDSRRRIAARLGKCTSVAYPFGEWDRRVARAAADAGYSLGFALPYGFAGVGADQGASPLSIPRIAVDHRDDERRFALKLTPAVRAFLLSPLKGMRPGRGHPALRVTARDSPSGR